MIKLNLNRDMVTKNHHTVSKAPQKAKKVQTDSEPANRVRYERSKCQAHRDDVTVLNLNREVFGSFVMLHVRTVLWFELMRGGVGMSRRVLVHCMTRTSRA